MNEFWHGTGLDTTQVREWARAQGIEVKDRGRVRADLVAKFKASTGQGLRRSRPHGVVACHSHAEMRTSPICAFI